jgi:hypothetical protein
MAVSDKMTSDREEWRRHTAPTPIELEKGHEEDELIKNNYRLVIDSYRQINNAVTALEIHAIADQKFRCRLSSVFCVIDNKNSERM